MAWWQRPKAEEPPAADPEPDDDTYPGWADTGDDDEEEEPAQGAGDDGATRLETAMQERAEFLRQKFAEKGIDISEDGEPVIRDPKRFRTWATPAVGVAAEQQRHTVETPPAQPAAPPPPPTSPNEPKEIWELTQADLERMIEEKAAKLAQPLIEQMQQQRNLVGKRWVDEATQKAADALSQVAPDYVHIIEHPQFEEMYKQQLSSLPPEYLDSPQMLASTAMSLLPWLDRDQMPQRKQVMDDQVARAAVNRSLVPNSRPSLSPSSAASSQTAGADTQATMAAKWLAAAGITRMSPEDFMALDAVDEWGSHSIEAYEKAKRKLARAKGGAR